jgi:hypothetical protein
MVLDAQHLLHSLHVRRINDRHASKISLSFRAFLRQDMTLVSMLSLDFPGSGQEESLLCATHALHFWHFS